MEKNSEQKNILFLPFLQIPSGHYQVANALMDAIQSDEVNVKCELVDILSYSYGKVEVIVSHAYLKWIKVFPHFYNWIYQACVYKNIEEDKRYRLYELLFVPFMRKLLKDKQPDLIICTHSLPSYILNYLKEREEIDIPVINVYTDYFIHSCWGMKYIDFHFVPSHYMKEFLEEKGIDSKRIFITGIPIHEKITKQKKYVRSSPNILSVLITGGNLGVGAMEDLLQKIGNKKIHYFVLCGKNKKLYQRIKQLRQDNITPLQYIASREEMNNIYDQVDAVITKPGGVTISESLFKRKPIFIYYALPGQEEINLQQLEKLGVIHSFKKCEETIEEQLCSFFKNNHQLQCYQGQVTEYHQQLITKEPSQIIKDLLK